jgi:hypothetical protein
MENSNILDSLEEHIYTQIKQKTKFKDIEFIYSLEFYLEILINLNIDNLINNDHVSKIKTDYNKWRR